MEREELAAWLRLAWSPGVGRVHARRLLAAFGLPQDIFRQPVAVLASVAGDNALALRDPPARLDAVVDATLEWLAAAPAGQRREVLTLADPSYPTALLDTEDPPLVLHAMGRADRAGWPRGIAIVGSRNPTPQGRIDAREFARAFARGGLTVVSGLALGIDGAAHEGALEGAAPDAVATIAVVGTGLDRVYPKQHRELAHRIAAQGLLVSEYPLGTEPLSEHFPARNRILSALGAGTLVVEAAVRSGSLITARMASEQGKDVFAIPGSIHSPQSRGCHALLKQGAKLVETAEDVLEELQLPAPASVATSAPDEVPLLRTLGHAPLSLDELVARTGCGAPDLQAQLLELELQGRVARLPGGRFQRLERG